jgi:hypothetical protein
MLTEVLGTLVFVMLVNYIKQVECCQILVQQLTKWYYSVHSNKRLNENEPIMKKTPLKQYSGDSFSYITLNLRENYLYLDDSLA